MSTRKKHQPAPGAPNFREGKYGSDPKPQIEHVRLLGTTWYTRGPAYWFRRILIFFAMLFISALQLLFAGIAFVVIAQDSSKSVTFRAIALTIAGTAMLAGFVYWTSWFIRQERRKRRDEIGHSRFAPEESGLTGFADRLADSETFGALGAKGCIFGMSLLTAGITPFLILQALQKEYGEERDARVRLQRWKRQHSTENSSTE